MEQRAIVLFERMLTGLHLGPYLLPRSTELPFAVGSLVQQVER